jgi:Uma2 family endonuclease
MIEFITDLVEVRVPEWVVDLESFRRWADTDDFPEKGHIWYLKGKVRIDMSKEQVFTHALVKTEITTVLGTLVKAGGLGLLLGDGPFYSNAEADVAGKPDASFVSTAPLRSKRVRLLEGMEEVHLELEGSPDMVLEVISRSSVNKDKVVLRQAYWEADIREYWLVDARKTPLHFDILRHTPRGYSTTRKRDGWMKSKVFGKSFRLTQRTNDLGHPEYTLEVG